MISERPRREGGKAYPPLSDDRRLRAWLCDVVAMAIEWLDDLDAQGEDLEDDELGDDPARTS